MNNYLDYLEVLKQKRRDNFLANTESSLSVKTNIEQVVRDLSWIEMIEESIPYLDNIVRNPRRFIVQEEDIIPIEKTKKITEESIKHLAKNTNLIQDIDEDGMVQPLKLLNVYKEETVDLYENRFIFSLLTNLKMFLNNQLQKDDGSLENKVEKVINYEGTTNINNETINVKLSIESKYVDEESQAKKAESSISERIENIVNVVDDFLSTQFIRSLNGATPVRSPIRKTNVILKEQNFIKALELWEFLEKYNIEETVKVNRFTKDEDVTNIINKYNDAYYLDYYAVNNASSKERDKIVQKEEYFTPYIKKVVEEYLSNGIGSEKEFKNLINKEFRKAKKKKQLIYNNIKNDYDELIRKHNEKIELALDYLD